MTNIQNEKQIKIINYFTLILLLIGFLSLSIYVFNTDDDFTAVIYLATGALIFGSIFKIQKTQELLYYVATFTSIFALIISSISYMEGGLLYVFGLSLTGLAFVLFLVKIYNDEYN